MPDKDRETSDFHAGNLTASAAVMLAAAANAIFTSGPDAMEKGAFVAGAMACSFSTLHSLFLSRNPFAGPGPGAPKFYALGAAFALGATLTGASMNRGMERDHEEQAAAKSSAPLDIHAQDCNNIALVKHINAMRKEGFKVSCRK